MKIIFGLVVGIALSLNVFPQEKRESDGSKIAGTSSGESLSAVETLAKKALEAHGGKKYREMRTLIVSGDVDITASVINQAVPATFLTILAGEKYRLEIDNPFHPL